MTSSMRKEISSDMSLYLGIHGKLVQLNRLGCISDESLESRAKWETFDVEYFPRATLNYNFHAKWETFDVEYFPWATLNYNLNLDKVVKEQPFIIEKIHLINVRWRFEFKSHRGCHVVRYVSPTGQSYCSLLQACLAWKQEKKIQWVIYGNHEDNV